MEVQTHDFIKDAIDAANAAAAEGDVLVGAALHDTVYGDITDDTHGVRVGDCDSDCAPVEDDEEEDGLRMEQFDARLTLVVFARVEGTEVAHRSEARLKARRLWLRLAKLFFNDTTMGERVRDVLTKRGRSGFDEEGGQLFAIVHLPLLVNGTGQLLEREESYQ